MALTDPSYISEQMFDKVVREKFQQNSDDRAVIQQAGQLGRLVRGSQLHQQILVDITSPPGREVRLSPSNWQR